MTVASAFDVDRTARGSVILAMRYRHLFEHTADVVLEIDATSGRIVDANPALCAALATARDALLSHGMLQDVFPDAGEWFAALGRRTPPTIVDLDLKAATGSLPARVYAFRCTDDSTPTWLLLARLRWSENGSSAGSNRIEQEVGDPVDVERVVGELVHDLQAPLRAVNGFAELLADEHGSHLDADGQQLLDLVVRNADRMRRLIEGLGRYGALASFEPRRELVDMDAVVSGILDARRSAEPAGKFEVQRLPLPPAHADAAAIRTVWAELLDNALKFGGPAPVIEVGYDPRAQAWYVRDHGVGFDGSQASSLFEPFKRLHSLDDFPGAGVGLAVVRRLLEKHGGRIWAEARPGGGATFRFTIPPS